MLDLIDFTYKMKHKLIKMENHKPYKEHKNLKNIPFYNLLKNLKDFPEKKNISERNLILEQLKKENKIIYFTFKYLKKGS